MYITDLIIKENASINLDDLLLDEHARRKIEMFIKEHYFADEFIKYSLPLNNKIFLHGASGCGKTATANAVAKVLGKELLVLNLSNIICARVGETAQNIKMVFDRAAKQKAVLFLDEFDQIAKLRSIEDKDLGEMRRLVTSIIQLIDYLPQDTILICATNHQEFIDPALLRRFQLKICFRLPTNEQLDIYYGKLLSKFPLALRSIGRLYGISYAEARDHSYSEVKARLITNLELQSSIQDYDK